MKKLRWELFSYSINFKESLSLLGYELSKRKGHILRLYDDCDGKLSYEIFGEGEIATLPGLHPESYYLAEKQIINHLSNENIFFNKPTKSFFSSVSFGLDMAKRTLINNVKNFLDDRTPNENKKNKIYKKKCIKIPVNGLAVGSGKKLENECRQLFDQGFQAVKIKVGQLTVKEDLDRVKLARKILGDKIEIRLDANRMWPWNEALKFCNYVKEYNIQYCEEPINDISKIEKLHAETKVPFALDETIWGNPNPKNLPKEGIETFILKPSILGGWSKTKLWVDYAEKKDVNVVLSSSFESGLGLNWNAYIAANLVKKQIPTGLDTAKWFKHDIIDPPFEIKNGFYKIPESWPKAKNSYLQLVDNGTIVTSS